MGAHPLYASACVGYVGLVAHSQNIGIGIGKLGRRVLIEQVRATVASLAAVFRRWLLKRLCHARIAQGSAI